MKFNIFDLLLPKETKFYDLLDKQVDALMACSAEFRQLVRHLQGSDNDPVLKSLVRIKECERTGAKVERSIMEELDRTFITPLDREDIHVIAMAMEKSLDLTNSLARKFEIYGIRQVPEEVVAFCDILVGISNELGRLIGALRQRKGLQEIIRTMHEFEKRGDDTFHQAMARLFRENNNPVELIKFKEVYEVLEEIIDSIDSVGRIIRGIMVKLG